MGRLTPLLTVVVALCLIACTPKPAPAPPGGLDQAAAPNAPATGAIRIAVVPKGVAHQFWTTVKAGAEAAAKEGGAEIAWKGPDVETDVARQKSIIEDFVTQRVSAIVMAACDADALVPTIEQAEAAGIPVITIDSGVKTDVRSLVAPDNVAGGKIAGETLFKLIGGSGEVALIPFVQGAASSEDREKGFKQAVDAAKDKGVKLVASRYCDSDAGKAKDITADILTAHPKLAGIFAANEPGAIGAANGLAEAHKSGKVKLVAYDGAPPEVKLLREGVIQALILQDPYRMGFLGVQQALKAIKGGTADKRVDTGVTVVTSANVDSAEVQKLLNSK
ncbi:MAG: ABC transporter substrate-binding protein [Armatimonadetes bacterium]|nr:ABC transporter substrate-binding protein [Armatimonadota bacterium]